MKRRGQPSRRKNRSDWPPPLKIEKAKADLTAAEAQVEVAEAEERRLAAMFAYTKITAPYDGVITTRNVNTGDFVRPASGDSSGSEGGSKGGSAPLFVIARTDPMMFVIGVPEIDAPYVSAGTKASLRLQALADREFNVTVTRTSLALQNQSRTLQAEIDLPNPDNELLPGMYAYGSIDIDRPNVRAIPTSATVQIGNRMCCYLVKEGNAVRTQIQSGVSDGTWIEVVKHRDLSDGWRARQMGRLFRLGTGHRWRSIGNRRWEANLDRIRQILAVKVCSLGMSSARPSSLAPRPFGRPFFRRGDFSLSRRRLC